MLSVYTLEQSEQWDAVVRSFREHDVYWLSGYVRAFQIHGDGEPMLFFYEDASVRGINVVMKRDVAYDVHFSEKIPVGQYFDFATPYGYGGWLIEGEKTDDLFAAYEKWCVEHNVISEFVRFHPVVRNHCAAETAYTVIPLGATIAMDTTSPEIIWENLTSKNRNVIRKAQKNGVRIYNGRSVELYRKFREIYNGTMDKDNAVDYYYFGEQFYDSVLYDLPRNAQIFYAEYEGQIIAASIMLSANGRMNYHLSGSLREYANLAASNLLLYEAALWANANGCKTMHLGGGVGSGEDSLFKFKRAFYRGEDLCRFHIGKKIMIPEKYEQLLAFRQDLTDTGFFPKYRA